jgi:hypothetical protein
MYLKCPACSNTLSVAQEHLGHVVQCPHCQKSIRTPAATGPAPGPAAESTKRCPHCGETILKVAQRCKFCKTDIPQGFDEESVAIRLKAKESLVAQQAANPDRNLPYSVTGWFQVSTIVVAALALVSIIAAAIGLPGGEKSPLFMIGIFGMMFSFLFVLFTLILGLRDLFAIKYSARQTPLKGAKAFWGGLCAKRYLFAYHCILEADKDESLRLRPAIPKFGVLAESCCFDQFEGFRDYWKNLLHKAGTQAAVTKLKVVRTQGDFAEVVGELKLTKQSTTGFLVLGVIGALLFATRDSMPVKKLFRQIDGQWYAVNGELDSGEDRFGLATLTSRR